jgi:hypothetical protein
VFVDAAGEGPEPLAASAREDDTFHGRQLSQSVGR